MLGEHGSDPAWRPSRAHSSPIDHAAWLSGIRDNSNQGAQALIEAIIKMAPRCFVWAF